MLDDLVAFITSVIWNPDGSQIAAIGGGVRIWNVITDDFIDRLPCGLCNAIAWSSDGRWIAASDLGGELAGAVHIYNPQSGAIYRDIITGIRSVSQVAWNTDNQTLAVLGEENIQLWDITSGERLATIDDQGRTMAWSPDGTQLAVGHVDGTITIWEREEQD